MIFCFGERAGDGFLLSAATMGPGGTDPSNVWSKRWWLTTPPLRGDCVAVYDCRVAPAAAYRSQPHPEPLSQGTSKHPPETTISCKPGRCAEARGSPGTLI